LLRIIRDEKLDRALVIPDWPVTAAQLAGLAKLVEAGTINRNTAKGLIPRLRGTGRDPAELVAAEGLAQVSDRGALEAAVADVRAAQRRRPPRSTPRHRRRAAASPCRRARGASAGCRRRAARRGRSRPRPRGCRSGARARCCGDAPRPGASRATRARGAAAAPRRSQAARRA